MDQRPGALEFLALHAVEQRKGQEQEPGGAVIFPAIRLALDEENDRIDAADHAPGDYFVQSVQFACFQFEALVPDRLRAPGEVEEPYRDVDQSPVPADAAIYGVVQVLPLKKVLATEIHQRPGNERNGSDYIEPTKPRQCRGNVVAQGGGQILASFGTFSLTVSFEGQDRDGQPIARRQRSGGIGFRARRRARRYIVLVIQRGARSLRPK